MIEVEQKMDTKKGLESASTLQDQVQVIRLPTTINLFLLYNTII